MRAPRWALPAHRRAAHCGGWGGYHDLGRDRALRTRAGVAERAARSRGSQRRQERNSGIDEPRVTHAAQRHARLCPATAARQEATPLSERQMERIEHVLQRRRRLSRIVDGAPRFGRYGDDHSRSDPRERVGSGLELRSWSCGFFTISSRWDRVDVAVGAGRETARTRRRGPSGSSASSARSRPRAPRAARPRSRARARTFGRVLRQLRERLRAGFQACPKGRSDPPTCDHGPDVALHALCRASRARSFAVRLEVGVTSGPAALAR